MVDTKAMVAGKQATQARTVWQLEVGEARFRCLRQKVGFTVQVRGPTGAWETFCRGERQLQLLFRLVESDTMVELLDPHVPCEVCHDRGPVQDPNDPGFRKQCPACCDDGD